MHPLILLSLAISYMAGSSHSCSIQRGIKLTNYGFPDASGTPAYKCNGNTVVPTQAGDQTELGDGSMGSPYAAAAATGSIFTECALLYVPILKKYFRVQDNCSGCVSKQVDLYLIQHNADVGQTQCEDNFGTFDYTQPLHEVIIAPGSGFPTNTQVLFDVSTKHCYNTVSDGRVFPGQDGHVTCAGTESSVDIDGTSDQVDNSGSVDDGDAKARHNTPPATTPMRRMYSFNG